MAALVRGKVAAYPVPTSHRRGEWPLTHGRSARATACANCHNEHADSPKKDFKEGDIMGGVVIRIPVAK